MNCRLKILDCRLAAECFQSAISNLQSVISEMIVGSLRVRLLIRESRSLKDKRQVVRSIKERLRNRYNVSVSEIEAQDHRQLAVFGMAMVCNEAQPIRTTFAEIVQALRCHPVAEFIDHEMEI
jgi:uncharacterized protein YlxP (DUF503 family)